MQVAQADVRLVMLRTHKGGIKHVLSLSVRLFRAGYVD